MLITRLKSIYKKQTYNFNPKFAFIRYGIPLYLVVFDSKHK